MTLLLAWHGLFVAAFTVAWITAESSDTLHIFSGWILIALLTVRLAAAAIAPAKSRWKLPWANKASWKGFARVFRERGIKVFATRTPLIPLSGLALLVSCAIAGLSGVAADAWRFDDPHEAATSLALTIVLIHIGLVLGGEILRRKMRQERRR